MKIPYVVGIAIVGIVIVTAIGYTQSSVDDSENKIRVAFFPSIVHAVPIVGIENQTFAENLDENLSIEIKVFDSGPQVIESIFSNSVDVAYVGPGPVINGFLKSDGKDLKILASAANGGASFIIQKNSGLESIENFSDLQSLMENIRNVLGSHEQVSLLKAYYSVADNMPEWNKLMPPLVNIENPKDNKHVTALLDLVGQIDTLIPSSS